MIRSRTAVGVAVTTAALLVFGTTAGCATGSDIESVRKLAQEAKESADRANRAAEEANANAREAKEAALAARTSSERTGEKVERAFKKSMQK